LGLPEAIQGSINLQAAGLSADQARDSLMGFGNALATVGRGKADLDGVITALSQVMSKGKVSAEEINQIAERVPQIRQIMKTAFGTADTEAIQKMEMLVDTFVSKVTTELKKLPPVTSGLRNNWDNAMDSMGLAILSVKEIVAPIIDKISQMVTKLATWFEGLSKPVKTVLLVFAGLAAVAGPILLGLGAIANALAGLVTIVTAIAAAPEVFLAILGALVAIAGSVTHLLAVGAAFYTLYKHSESFRESVKNAWETVKTAFGRMWDSVKKLWGAFEPLRDVLKKIGEVALNVIGTVLGKVFEAIAVVLAMIIDQMTTLIELVNKLLGLLNQKSDARLLSVLQNAGIDALKKTLRDLSKIHKDTGKSAKEASDEEAQGVLDVIEKRRQAAEELRKEQRATVGFKDITDLWNDAMVAGARASFGTSTKKTETTVNNLPGAAELKAISRDIKEQKEVQKQLISIVRQRLGTLPA
jgi:tape measure domain-containing protein